MLATEGAHGNTDLALDLKHLNDTPTLKMVLRKTSGSM